MDTIAHFVAEYVVDEAVLSDPSEAFERGGGDHRIEVMPVPRDLGPSTRYPGLYPLLQLLWGHTCVLVWRSRHTPSVAAAAVRRYTS